jgi:hypothetical protein
VTVLTFGDRVLCGDATNPEAVLRLLGERAPALMVTDPSYGIELDSEWRDRAGLNGCGPAEASYMKHRTEGHTETTISGDTRADWSEAFELVPSIQVAYVWHASVFTREVLNGLLRIGFLYPQQIIWNNRERARDPIRKGGRCSRELTIGTSMSRVGTSERRTRPGSGRPARTPRFGIPRVRNSLWEGATSKSSIIRRRSRSS